MLSALRLSLDEQVCGLRAGNVYLTERVLSRGIMRVTVPLFAQMFAVHFAVLGKELVATL